MTFAHTAAPASRDDALAGDGLDRLGDMAAELATRCREHYRASVEPCVIGGRRALVHDRGLRRRAPKLFDYLERFARRHGIRLQEDRRAHDAPVVVDRRRRLAPIVALVAGVLAQPGTALASPDTVELAPAGIRVAFGTRANLPIRDGGKRFAAGPLGRAAEILDVAAITRRHGTRRLVSTEGMTVPDKTMNATVARYDYTFPAECGGHAFSYFEGEGFHALGHHQGDRVVVDVLVGGGPFTAPRLWGPFDQVINDSVEMHLVIGSGERDGFGLMKASYSVGMVAAMPSDKAAGYGRLYENATHEGAACVATPSTLEASLPAPARADAAPAPALAVAPSVGVDAALDESFDPSLADGTLDAEVSAPQGRMLYGARDHLPVRDEGARFVDAPFGEAHAILAVADAVKAAGRAVRTSTRHLKIPNPQLNRWVTRYDHEFTRGGARARFSLYEGRGFRALALHVGERIVLDVIEGGAFSAPRLWGTYDQVLNDRTVAMHLLVGDGQSDGFGLLKASFMAGMVAGIPKAARDRLGRDYREAVSLAMSTLPERDHPTPPGLRQANATLPEVGS